jgi:hypothetical protein
MGRDGDQGDRTAGLDLRALKARVSPRLLAIDGVTGVGIAGRTLAVYLEADSEAVRQEVAALLDAEAPGVPVSFTVTGWFRAHGDTPE